MRKSILIILVCLIPKLSVAQLTTTLPAENCFTLQDLQRLANKTVICQKCQAELQIIRPAYEKCIDTKEPSLNIWSPTLQISVAGVSFMLGASFVATHCFGLCR